MHRSFRFRQMFALAIPAATLLLTSSAQAGLINDWNVVVTGNAYVRTETEGPMRIGGNLYTDNAYNVAPRAGSLSGSGGYALIVGGNVATSDTKILNQGNALIGSYSNASIAMNSGGTLTVNPTTAAAIVAGDAAELASTSQAFKAMAANNTFATNRDGNAGLFTVTAKNGLGNAVFNVTAAQVFGNSSLGRLDLNLNGFTFADGQSIVINVSGSTVNFNVGNFDGAFSNAANTHVLWNFHEATEINMNNRNLKGSLLAPNATLLNTNTIDGGVFVRNLGTNTGNGQLAEIHPPYQGTLYNGFTPSVVPEPSSIVMALMGLGAVVGIRNRLARRAA